ncbi:MAG: response regulator [Megasphaera sp.]|jgi:CitB family two-component system response regulator MalR|nr:response regulator [Megasphaera sp.]MCI1248299.1 response regulator [Megasphaera sp.]
MIQVLIIEDDPMVAEINKVFLSKISGFAVAAVVNNGSDAWKYLEKHPQNVQLILLDVFMPKMDGFTFLKKLKHTYPVIDVIMITAAQSGKDVKRALSHGVVDYIIKPFTFERMALALNTYKNRLEILKDSEAMDQSVIDKGIFQQKSTSSSGTVLPKGIDKQTLAQVKAAAARQDVPFSTQDLAAQVDISRISLKKYLNYLEERGVLKGTLNYRAKGRPVLLYRYMLK